MFPLTATAPGDCGIAALRAHLHAAAARSAEAAQDGLFRLAIDRVFTRAGAWGTVATGTARAGRVQVGDTLAVMPAGTPVRVRSIHAQHRGTGVGVAGERCALNFAGIEKTALARGDWLADPRALAPTTRIDVRLRRLAAGGALKDRAALHIHLGTAHQVARVVLLDGAGAQRRRERARATRVRCADLRLAGRSIHCARCAGAAHPRRRDRHRSLRAGAAAPTAASGLTVLDAMERLLGGEGIDALLRRLPQGIEMRELARLCGRPPERVAMPQRACG